MAVKAEQIHRAASKLAKAGFRPTCRAVRAALGVGNLTTIGKHLRTWRAQHAADAVAVSYLVAVVQDASADARLRLDAAKTLLRHAGRLADDEAGAGGDEWGELLPR